MSKKLKASLQTGIKIRVTGEITSISDRSFDSDIHNFTVHAAKHQQYFKMTYKGFLQIRKGDTITAECTVLEDSLCQITCLPRITIPTDQDFILECFAAAIVYVRSEKSTVKKCKMLYDVLLRELADHEMLNVSQYMTHLSDMV